ncbi:uncharacterized protein LAESUDRAFT_724649 [Laetiporus sulphureus 93-53]|uniref:Uncharacterized protein n=1 Tax=Laetiporus sulphureus 93-53 TaxID=1314785 RepID=A0A165ESF9_9APHY|nr:uncharacterized protein LAESUDRAFT_724649 [Laetiporus sulphureus 93-53]KZT07667.1 hypothetical protein LAESUDRAFT_724649 [Laetiporus sulphureus 93-53]
MAHPIVAVLYYIQAHYYSPTPVAQAAPGPLTSGCRSLFHVLPCPPRSVRQSRRPLILGPSLRTICIPYVLIFGDFL